MSSPQIDNRSQFAIDTVVRVAAEVLTRFHDRSRLTIESKGRQDWVSDADRAAEDAIRAALAARFPDDGVVGEERAVTHGTSGYTWVIDPIDGTSLFVNGIPGWCVVLACVHAGDVVIGVIVDPVAGECFSAVRGGGTWLDGDRQQVVGADALDAGLVAVGHSLRVPASATLAMLDALLASGGMFYRSGSGALNLTYVAAGRLIGYVEPHMNAWDCLAALLMIEEAGGRVLPMDLSVMLAHGGRVVAGTPGTFDMLADMAGVAYPALSINYVDSAPADT